MGWAMKRIDKDGLTPRLVRCDDTLITELVCIIRSFITYYVLLEEVIHICVAYT